MQPTLRNIGLTITCGVSILAQTPDPKSCERLKSLALANTTISAAETVPAGPFTLTRRGANSAASLDLPAYCRVAATIKPTADSDIEIVLWMPVSEWNRKLLAIGNGGWAGGINTLSLAFGLREHYATVSTDRGHNGSSASFALGHPEKLTDFAYRAVHEMTLQTKAIIAVYYGNAPKYSYFTGCSSGGDQGLREAQRYPEDYDGVVAGAPGNYWTHLMATGLWIAQATLKDKASFLPPAKLRLLNRAVLAACDSLDGINDGLLDDPRRCRFDPATLLCPSGEDSPTCLTGPQVEAIKKIYAGPTSPRTRAVIYPGLEPGSEPGWAMIAGGPEPFQIHYDHYRYIVHEDSTWDWHTFDLDRDVALADQKDHGTLNAIEPDLQRFESRGGKIILYHGWSDPFLAPGNTINYYESVATAMGKATTGFIRLFLVPGMEHCRGGPGPNQFNALAAVERWVEAGIAPDRIIAQHVTESRVDLERPLCPYPQVARWRGIGSTNDASNFACVAPPPTNRPK